MCLALLRLLSRCAQTVGSDVIRRTAIDEQARILHAAAVRDIAEPEDTVAVTTAATSLREALSVAQGRAS